MSRDPLNGASFDPKSLHKYQYAEGDPVNATDPSGQEALIVYAAFTRNRAQAATVFGFKLKQCLAAAFLGISDDISAGFEDLPAPESGDQIASQLGVCTANAIKSQLGFILNHI